MTKTILLATVVSALIAAPALAQSSPMKNEAAGMHRNGGAMTTGAAPMGREALPTQEFVDKAAMSDMFEIQAAGLAKQKDRRKADDQFAQRMVKDHHRTTEQLKALIASGKVKAQVPAALDPQLQKTLDHLKALNGAAFDEAYVKSQLQGHQAAVAMFGDYARSGDNPALKQWAKATLPTLETHLGLAENLNQ